MDLRRRILALLLLLCATALHAQPVPFADLARHVQYESVKISPDGQYLAAIAVVKGRSVLALIHLADMKGHVVQPRDKDEIVDFWWASPKRVVYTVGIRMGGYDSPLATGELFGINADGGGPELLYGYRNGSEGSAEFITSLPDDPNHVLLSLSSWSAAGTEGALSVAYSVGLRGGFTWHKIIAAPGRDMEFVADHHGRIRFAYGEDVNGNAKVYLHPIDGEGWQEMAKAEAERCIPWMFKSDDSVAYFNCTQAGAGSNVSSWDPVKDVWQTVWSNPKVEADGLLYGMTDAEPIGVSFAQDRPAAVLFDGTSDDAKALVLLMKQFPGESVRFVSGTRDGSLAVVLVQADADPGTYYLYDRHANKLTPLLAVAPWIDPQRMARKQPFEFAARDGMKIQGYISFPPGRENARHLPMVVFVHGGPRGVRDDWD